MTDDEEADRIIDKLKYSKKELEFNDLMDYCIDLARKVEYLPVIAEPPCEPKFYYANLHSTPIITNDYIVKLTY